jgi:anti-sigma B factor antagonist
MMHTVQITSEIQSNVCVIKLSGRMVLDQSLFRLREHVLFGLESGVRRFVIDISEVTHLDSSGCGEVISAHTSIHRAKGLLGFVNPTTQVRQLWTHTRLIEVLNIFESIDDAHEFLRR